MTMNQAAKKAQMVINRGEATTDNEMREMIITLSGRIAEGESTLELRIELENALEGYFDAMEEEYHERFKAMQRRNTLF